MKKNMISFYITLLVLSILTGCNMFDDVTPPADISQITSPLNVLNQSETGLITTTPVVELDSKDNTQKQNMSLKVQIEGQLKNVSGTKLKDDVLITLHGYHQGVEVYTKTTPCNMSNLSFVFKDVFTYAEWYFFTSVTIDEVSFYSDVIKIQEKDEQIVLPISIYKLSSDISVLEIEKLQVFLDFTTPDVLQVMQMVVISNLSSTMVVSSELSQGGVIPYYLPKQVNNLKFFEGFLGERYIKTENGFMDTVPISPGQNTYQIIYVFEIPFKQKLDYSQAFPINIKNIVFFIPLSDDNSIKIKSDQLRDFGTQEIEGKKYQVFKGENINIPEKLQMTMIASPTKRSIEDILSSLILSTNIDARLLFGLAFFGIALIGIGVWIYRRDKQEKNSFTSLDDEERFDEPENIMDVIIALDERYKSGDIPEHVYHKRRAKLKTALANLLELAK